MLPWIRNIPSTRHPFHYLFIYQLQQLAFKSVNFHVTMDLALPFTSPPIPLSLYILATTISLKNCPFSCYNGLGISLHLTTLSTISLYTLFFFIRTSKYRLSLKCSQGFRISAFFDVLKFLPKMSLTALCSYFFEKKLQKLQSIC